MFLSYGYKITPISKPKRNALKIIFFPHIFKIQNQAMIKLLHVLHVDVCLCLSFSSFSCVCVFYHHKIVSRRDQTAGHCFQLSRLSSVTPFLFLLFHLQMYIIQARTI